MRVLIVTHPTPLDIRKFFQLKDDDYIIGVDQAVSAMYKQRVPVHLAIGDFDSLKNKGILNQLNKIELNSEKDQTDTYQALVEATKLNPDEIFLIGGFGGNRIEHFIANIALFNEFNITEMIDENTSIKMYEKGKYHTSYDGFISIFAYPKANISLYGFKYELDRYDLDTYNPLGVSNELKLSEGTIEINEGRVLVYYTKKD